MPETSPFSSRIYIPNSRLKFVSRICPVWHLTFFWRVFLVKFLKNCRGYRNFKKFTQILHISKYPKYKFPSFSFLLLPTPSQPPPPSVVGGGSSAFFSFLFPLSLSAFSYPFSLPPSLLPLLLLFPHFPSTSSLSLSSFPSPLDRRNQGKRGSGRGKGAGE